MQPRPDQLRSQGTGQRLWHQHVSSNFRHWRLSPDMAVVEVGAEVHAATATGVCGPRYLPNLLPLAGVLLYWIAGAPPRPDMNR